MLQQLSIRNYALIDSLEVSFGKGLTVLTGETGSGKSIIIEALELLLGERADTGVLRDKTEKCIIEGEFLIRDYKLQAFFDAAEIDYADLTLLRREITPQAKSRAFINDTPVTLSLMKELGRMLVDIHSQHETLLLNKSVNQFDILDNYARVEKEKVAYSEVFARYKNWQRELETLKAQEAQSRKDLDYFRFQYKELEEAELKEGEQEEAEQELNLLQHAETIKSTTDSVIKTLEGSGDGLISRIREIKQELAKISAYDARIAPLSERLESMWIELRDISEELEAISDKVNDDPERITQLTERINQLNGLLFKHRESDVAGLIRLRTELEASILQIDSLEERIAAQEKALEQAERELQAAAGVLSARRRAAVEPLEKEVRTILTQLAMPHAQLRIELQPLPEPGASGADDIRFLFNSNKGGEFKELGKVASGGEFSRLMLALKSVLARVNTLSTLIFDEIDTGVSGEVAHKMGAIMRDMGNTMQVFSITHLPQVASRGNAHYKVFKQTGRSSTETRIRALTPNERIEEIARMLSGDKLSEAALANARELIG